MSYQFHVGQRVVCIEPKDDPQPPNPIFCHVYTVSWVGICGDEVHLDLVELPLPDSDDFYRGYRARNFRPVVERKTDISQFKAMLNKPTVGVPA